MMKYLYLIAFFCVITACSNSKNAIKEQSSLKISDVTPGKSSTAILGKLTSVQQTEGNIRLSILVNAVRQGGASAPAFGVNSETSIVIAPAFQKEYLDRTGASVKSVLDEGATVLAVVDRDLKSREIQLIQLKTQK